MNVLLVMHNHAAAQELSAAWQEMGLVTELSYIRDAAEASACLARTGSYEGQSHPDIVIVSNKLNAEAVRKLYCIDAGCCIDPPRDLGRFLRLLETRGSVSATLLVIPAQCHRSQDTCTDPYSVN